MCRSVCGGGWQQLLPAHRLARNGRETAGIAVMDGARREWKPIMHTGLLACQRIFTESGAGGWHSRLRIRGRDSGVSRRLCCHNNVLADDGACTGVTVL